jgi:hypothetical protein
MSYIGNEPIVSATRTVTEVTATAGQTVFNANGGYTVGYLDVFLNGSKLTSTDFTATNGTTVTLTEAAQVNDIVRLEALGTFSVADVDVSSISATGTPSSTTYLRGDGSWSSIASSQWTTTGSDIYYNTGNVGIGTSSPAAKLGIQSSSDGSDSIRIRSAKGNAVDGLYGTIIFSSSTSSSFDVNGASISSGSYYIDGGDLRFSTSNGGSRIERGRFTVGGDFQFNSGYGSVATAYGCRAWVNFNGTGTVAIRASGNVSSITDRGVGLYTINFTNAMPDANYTVASCGTSSANYRTAIDDISQAPQTTGVRIITQTGNGIDNDTPYGLFSIFR